MKQCRLIVFLEAHSSNGYETLVAIKRAEKLHRIVASIALEQMIEHLDVRMRQYAEHELSNRLGVEMRFGIEVSKVHPRWLDSWSQSRNAGRVGQLRAKNGD